MLRSILTLAETKVFRDKLEILMSLEFVYIKAEQYIGFVTGVNIIILRNMAETHYSYGCITTFNGKFSVFACSYCTVIFNSKISCYEERLRIRNAVWFKEIKLC